MDFWTRVQEGIDRENTTYAYIAEKLKKRESTVSGWHRNKKKIIPPADHAVTIAKILNTTVEYLVTGGPPEGIPPDILAIARKIALLPTGDQEELLAIAELKLAKLCKAKEN
jgi:transcriptional regulator with XRE-family HTH domain